MKGKGKGKGYGPPMPMGGPMGPMGMNPMLAMMKGAKGKGKGGGLSDFPAEKKVWVGNIASGVTYSDLQSHFNSVGTAKFAMVMKGKGAGTGGVAFATAEDAKKAKSLDGSTL